MIRWFLNALRAGAEGAVNRAGSVVLPPTQPNDNNVPNSSVTAGQQALENAMNMDLQWFGADYKISRNELGSGSILPNIGSAKASFITEKITIRNEITKEHSKGWLILNEKSKPVFVVVGKVTETPEIFHASLDAERGLGNAVKVGLKVTDSERETNQVIKDIIKGLSVLERPRAGDNVAPPDPAVPNAAQVNPAGGNSGAVTAANYRSAHYGGVASDQILTSKAWSGDRHQLYDFGDLNKPEFYDLYRKESHKHTLWENVKEGWHLFRHNPIKMGLFTATNLLLAASAPLVTTVGGYGLVTSLQMALYQYFMGANSYFNNSTQIHVGQTTYAGKSDGEPFVYETTLNKEEAAYLLDVARNPNLKNLPGKYSKFITNDENVETRIIRQSDGSAKFRFSYGTLWEDAQNFYHFMLEEVIPAAQADLQKITDKNSLEYKTQEELINKLYSVTLLGVERMSQSRAGRKERGLANRIFIDMDKEFALRNGVTSTGKFELDKNIESRGAAYIHEQNGLRVLQINYLMTREDFNILLADLSAYGYDAPSLEKVKIAYKIVQDNFYAETKDKSYLGLEDWERLNVELGAATYTGMPINVLENMLYNMVYQLDTTPFKLFFNMLSNAPNIYDTETYGLIAAVREKEARMHAILKLLGLSRLGSNYADDPRSQNHNLLALMLADTRGRIIDQAVVLDEAIKKAFPADGAERYAVRTGLQELDIYNSTDEQWYFAGYTVKIDDEGKDAAARKADAKNGIIYVRDLLYARLHFDNKKRENFNIKNIKDIIEYIHKDIDNFYEMISMYGNPERYQSIEQIDKFMEDLRRERRVQALTPKIANIMAGFWRSGKFDPQQKNELAAMLPEIFQCDAAQALAYINNLESQRDAVINLTREYTGVDLGSEKVNDINLEVKTANNGPALSTKKLVEFYSWSRLFIASSYQEKRSDITIMLDAREGGGLQLATQNKELEDWRKVIEGKGSSESVGGLTECIRWTVEEHKRMDRAQSIEKSKKYKNNTIEQISARHRIPVGVPVEEIVKLDKLDIDNLKAVGFEDKNNTGEFEYHGITIKLDEKKEIWILTFRANTRFNGSITRLMWSPGLSEANRTTLLNIAKKYNVYLSTFSSEDEKLIHDQTTQITQAILRVMDKHSYDEAVMQKEIEERSDPQNAKYDAYFAKQSPFEQIEVIQHETDLKIGQEIKAALAALAAQHPELNLTDESNEALLEKIMERWQEGRIRQLAVLRGLVAQVNMASRINVLDGKVILDSKQSAPDSLVRVAIESKTKVDDARWLRDGVLAQGTNERKVFDALVGILKPYGDKKASASAGTFQQLAFSEIANGTGCSSLANALKLAAEHEFGKKYKVADHWYIEADDLIGKQEGLLGGEEIKENWGGKKLVLARIDEPLKNDKDKIVAPALSKCMSDEVKTILKGMKTTELEEFILAAAKLLEAEAQYRSDLEEVLISEYKLPRDVALAAVDLLQDNLAVDQAVSIDAHGAVKNYLDYHGDGGKVTVDKKNTRDTLVNDILGDYITAKAAEVKSRGINPEQTEENPTMFFRTRFSGKVDDTTKPADFNMSYFGQTPFEEMQKMIKTVMQWYRAQNGAYTLKQIWEKWKEEQGYDTLSVSQQERWYRGKKYPFWNLLDEVFAELDTAVVNGQRFSLNSFAGASVQDQNNNYYDKLEELFKDYMLEISPKISAENRDTLIRVIHAQRTMSEKIHSIQQGNSDKDNWFHKDCMHPLLHVYRYHRNDSGIYESVNEWIQNLQAQQGMSKSRYNLLQDSGQTSMNDFGDTTAYVQGQYGREQDQGCFNWHNLQNDQYAHLFRSVLEISSPVNKRPPRWLQKAVIGGISTVTTVLGYGGAALLLAAFNFNPISWPFIMLIPTLLWFNKGLPKLQGGLRKVYERIVNWLDSRTPPGVGNIRTTMDGSKKASAVEDYAVQLELEKSLFLFSRQMFSTIGMSPAEGEPDVRIEVQSPRWDLAHAELYRSEMLGAEFYKKLIEKGWSADVLERRIKARQEGAEHGRYSWISMNLLRFPLIMSVYAVFNLSPLAFHATVLTPLFAGIYPAITLLSAVAMAYYMVNKLHISIFHKRDAGITRFREKIAETISLITFGTLTAKIKNGQVSTAKMPFVPSEPVFTPMIRYFEDLYLSKIANKNYYLETRANIENALLEREAARKAKNTNANTNTNTNTKIKKDWLYLKERMSLWFQMRSLGFETFLKEMPKIAPFAVSVSMVFNIVASLFFGGTAAAAVATGVFTIPLLFFSFLAWHTLWVRPKKYVERMFIGISPRLEHQWSETRRDWAKNKGKPSGAGNAPSASNP